MSTFELAKKLGYESPLRFNQDENNKTNNASKFYITGDIDFQKLVNLLKGKSLARLRDSRSFTKGQIINIGGYGLNKKSFEEYLLGKEDRKPSPSFSPNKSNVPLKINQNELFFNGYIIETSRTSPRTIDISKAIFAKTMIIEEKYYLYRIIFPFNTIEGNSIYDKYGIIIETDIYGDFKALVDFLGITLPQDFQDEIKAKFKAAFDASEDDCNIIDAIYEYAPDFVIANKKSREVWNHLKHLSKCGIDRESFFSGTDENIAVINILLNFPNKKFLYNEFWKFPEVLNDLLYRIDDEYLLEFLKAITIAFMDNWKKEDFEHTEFFTFFLDDYEFDDPEKKERIQFKIVSWCEKDDSKEKMNYEAGYEVFSFSDYDLIASNTKLLPKAWFDAINPVRASYQGEVVFIPAFVAAYLTTEKSLDNRQAFINDYVLSAFLSTPSSIKNVSSGASATAKVSRGTRLRSKITDLYNKVTIKLKQRIKSLKKSIKKNSFSLSETIEAAKRQQVEELYKKGYDYLKVGMPSGEIITKLFTRKGNILVAKLNKVFDKYKKTLGSKAQDERVLVSGIICKKYVKEPVFHTNYPRKALKKILASLNTARFETNIDIVKKIYDIYLKEGFIKYPLHRFLEKRIIRHFETLEEGITFRNYNLWQTGGIPGIHSELLSINEMLHRVEAVLKSKNIEMTEEIFSEMIGFNRRFNPLEHGDVMIRCLDCNFISFDVPFIEIALKQN